MSVTTEKERRKKIKIEDGKMKRKKFKKIRKESMLQNGGLLLKERISFF